MDQFPSNSHNQRGRQPAPEAQKKAEIQRVVEGKVVRRKKSRAKRLKEVLFTGLTLTEVWEHMAFEVLVPAARDAMWDAFTGGAERMIYRDDPRSNRRRHRPGGLGHINYNRYSGSSRGRERERDERPQMSRRGRANFDFDEIILDTRGEAEEVIDRLFDAVAKYEMVTVADLYEMVGVAGSYTDEKYGWTDIQGARPVRVRNGYLLDLPRPEPLE